MFAMSVRVSPCSERSSPRSVGRVTTTVPSSCAIAMRSGTCCCRVPRGPATATRPGSTETVTPEGISMGFFPIRLIRSPDEADDLATDPALLRGPARDEPGGRGQDRDAHSSQHARETILPRVDPTARLGDALQARDDPFAIPAELEIDDQSIEGFALLDVIVPDVALLLEEAGDLHLHARRRHDCLVLERLVRVPDAGEHVGDRIGQHRVTSSISSCRESRPDGRGLAGRCGRGRTCGTPRAAGRTGYSACSCAPGTSAGASA